MVATSLHTTGRMNPTDAGGETYLDHVANAIQPLMNLAHAPSLFTAAEARDIIDGAQARLERALHLLLTPTGTKEDV